MRPPRRRSSLGEQLLRLSAILALVFLLFVMFVLPALMADYHDPGAAVDFPNGPAA